MAYRVMTVEEAAEYLRLNPSTVYRRARTGEIPAVRVGGTIRFVQEVIDEWLRLSSWGWSVARRQELYAWSEAHARQRGWKRSDVLRAVRTHRTSG